MLREYSPLGGGCVAKGIRPSLVDIYCACWLTDMRSNGNLHSHIGVYCRYRLRAICIHESKVILDLWRLIYDHFWLFASA